VLLSTRKEGPTAISRVKAGDNDPNAPDPSKIAKTLGEELARVSAGINFKTDLAREVLNELNAERAAEGLSALQMDTNSNAYKIAQLFAADMAIYDHSDYDSPLYGTLASLLSRFGITITTPSQNIWKTTASKSAGAIHSRFMTLDGARQARMSSGYTSIGMMLAGLRVGEVMALKWRNVNLNDGVLHITEATTVIPQMDAEGIVLSRRRC